MTASCLPKPAIITEPSRAALGATFELRPAEPFRRI